MGMNDSVDTSARDSVPVKPATAQEGERTEAQPADNVAGVPGEGVKIDSAAGYGADESGQALPPTEAGSVKAESEVALLRAPDGKAPATLKGSLESLERQNAMLDAEGLERIEDEDDLAARIANKMLVPVPESTALTVNADLEANHRYCRPWTAQFLSDLATAHEAVFHRPLLVSSAVRTVEYQKRLMEINGNAAPAEGDVVSPHLTGATVDIAKSGMNRQEKAWMRRRLGALEAAGKIDVEEEFHQACFHITVYKSYEEAPRAPGLKRSKRRTPSGTQNEAATKGM